MKKLMSIVIAVLLITCLACPAFAAGSTTDACDVTATDKDGKEVAITATDATETYDVSAGVDFGDGVVPAKDLTVVYQQNLSAASLPVTITFTVPAAGANDILHVMHYTGGKWVQVAQAKGSSVTATFDSLSPVAVVMQTNVSSGSGTPTSPQTGMNMTALFASVAVMLMAGAVAVAAAKKHVKE